MKWAMVAATITVYFALPAYRYYLIGSLIAYRLMKNPMPKVYPVPKGSKTYKRLVGDR